MADSKTSALPTASPAAGDKLYLSQTSGGPTDKAAVVSAALAALFAGSNPFPGLPINTQTGDYTLALADADKLVEMNKATANTLTVPANASVAFPVGTRIVVSQYGAGATTVAAAGGVTLREMAGGTLTLTQYATLLLVKRATNEWYALPMSSGSVTSVFGRTGTVVAASGDYTFAQIGSKPTTLSGYGITDALPLAGGTLTGNLLFSTDNTKDIGASGATRPRTVYVGTSVVTPLLNNSGSTITLRGVTYTLPSADGSSGQVLTTNGSATLSWSAVNLTALNASNLTSGTVPDARFPATLPAASGANLTSLNASNLASGTVDPARLGSGSSISTKFLRGDSTWQTIGGGGDALTSNPLSQFASTTSAQLAGVMSDETGSGALVFAGSPTFTGTISGAALTLTGLLLTAATASGSAGIRLPHGTAPSSPTNGDLWTTTAGLYARINGTTVGPYGVGTALTSGTLGQFASTTSAQLAGIMSDETGSGALVFGTSPTLTTPTLTRPTLTGERYTKTAPTISSGTLELDYSAGTVFYVDLNANITTLTISNWPSSGTFGRISVRFKADGTARTIAWPAAVKWDGGTAPTMASTNGHVTWVHLVTAEAGTAIDGLIGAADLG